MDGLGNFWLLQPVAIRGWAQSLRLVQERTLSANRENTTKTMKLSEKFYLARAKRAKSNAILGDSHATQGKRQRDLQKIRA